MTPRVKQLEGTPLKAKQEDQRAEGEKPRVKRVVQEKYDNFLGRARRRPWLFGGIAAAIVIVLLGGIAWWLHARQYESTDDAFIDARTVAISSQVNGAIVALLVSDNTVVEEGAVLIRIDSRDYQAALDQAVAKKAQDEANLKNTQLILGRYSALVGQSVVTREQFDTQHASVDQLSALVKADEAAIESAQANFDRTVIRAPTAGRVTKLTAAVGAYAQVGQALTMFVPRDMWVTANFKETQLTFMRPGQPVEISIDAFPDRTFHGRVDSLQAGSGTVFSLLPAENATGNYVKVVQRVPVKITFDQIPDAPIGPGMSVTPTVKVR
jgi:membrane fusion protein (multidrug efflux system)